MVQDKKFQENYHVNIKQTVQFYDPTLRLSHGRYKQSKNMDSFRDKNQN